VIYNPGKIGLIKIANRQTLDISTSDAATAGLVLDRTASAPMHAQLTLQLREMILTGRIQPGARLPASRLLALELGVSRITVTTSMDQLIAEGFLEGVQGRGLFVVSALPDTALKNAASPDGFELEQLPGNAARAVPFQPSSHDPRLFPDKEWAKLLERGWLREKWQIAPIGAAGFGPLREAIARHLNEWRGLRCQPSQVFITTGGVDAIQLIIRAIGLSGKAVVLEDPGYPLFANELSHHGAHVVAVAVDEQGICPGHMPAAAMVIVTPSRHFPNGASMPVSRRLDLLAWSKRHDAMIVEDDFDSEYRYRGTPLPTLMGQDGLDRVIYLGSFSKVFSPLLRLGYIIVPPSRVEQFNGLINERGAVASATAQPALARFMLSGAFAAHIRRMRRIYSSRQDALIASVGRHLGGLLSVQREAGGMHLVARIAPELGWRMNDVQISDCARAAGLALSALSSYCTGPAPQQGLLMGYSGFQDEELEAACQRLANALQA